MKVNIGVSQRNYANSLGQSTLLNNYIGYAKAAEITKIAVKENKSVIDVIRERKILSEAQMNKLFNEK